jgi:hypothetical protein
MHPVLKKNGSAYLTIHHLDPHSNENRKSLPPPREENSPSVCIPSARHRVQATNSLPSEFMRRLHELFLLRRQEEEAKRPLYCQGCPSANPASACIR